MATITITIPDPDKARVENAFADKHRYEQNKLAGPPVETKEEFLKRNLKDYVMESVADAEGDASAKTSRASARANAMAINITVT